MQNRTAEFNYQKYAFNYPRGSDYIKLKANKITYINKTLTSGTVTNAIRTADITKLTQNSHLRKIKYEATTEPKWDSISFIFSSHGMNQLERLAASRL